MGASKSKVYALDSELKKIKTQLEDLKAIDKNNDGIISKDEFKSWKDEQKIKMLALEKKVEEQVNNKYNKLLLDQEREIAEAKKQIEELAKQNKSLKTINTTLEDKLFVAHEQSLNLPQGKLQELSKQKIDEFVEQLLADKNVNIGYLPDFVERQLYKNIFGLLIGLLDNTVSTTSIKLLGHNLTFNITPDMSKPESVMKSDVPDDTDNFKDTDSA